MTNTVQLRIDIPRWLRDAARDAASDKGIKLAQFVRLALAERPEVAERRRQVGEK